MTTPPQECEATRHPHTRSRSQATRSPVSGPYSTPASCGPGPSGDMLPRSTGPLTAAATCGLFGSDGCLAVATCPREGARTLGDEVVHGGYPADLQGFVAGRAGAKKS